MFALFAGDVYHPEGGMNDFVGRFDTIEAARIAFDKDPRSWGHIVDLSTMKIVVDYLHSNMKSVQEFQKISISYRDSLEAAGARVVDFNKFGDHQGSWLALVEYRGECGWVQGAYGSCDECDAFQREFDWDADEAEDYPQRLATFGRNYLDDIQTTEQVLRQYDDAADWDSESESAAVWVRHIVEKG